jgi:hypothetical protein
LTLEHLQKKLAALKDQQASLMANYNATLGAILTVEALIVEETQPPTPDPDVPPQ